MALRLSAVAVIALVAGPAAAQVVRTAPDFVLQDTGGASHALRDLRGRIVVLEWTSHRCDAVKRAHDDSHLAATKAAVRGDDVVWLCVDSDPASAERLGEIDAWRRARGSSEPWLLDRDGAVGARFGARVTPHVFVVDPTGAIVFAGGLGDGQHRPVADAVVALRRGGLPWPGVAAPIGTPIPYAAGRDAGGALFEAAAAKARDGAKKDALGLLARSFAAGFPTPNDVLHHGSFAPLRSDFDARMRLRKLLEANVREASAVMVDAGEKGEPLLVTGTVRDASGEPLAGVLVYAYHTDAQGLYAEVRNDLGNRRLFAFVRTNADGRYELRTIRPGAYPSGDLPQHVHLAVRPTGAAEKEFELRFADDPIWRGKPPSLTSKVTRGSDGVARCTKDLALKDA
jgi:hypothetical protein